MEWIIETGKIAALTFATDHGGIIPTFQHPESRIQNPRPVRRLVRRSLLGLGEVGGVGGSLGEGGSQITFSAPIAWG